MFFKKTNRRIKKLERNIDEALSCIRGVAWLGRADECYKCGKITTDYKEVKFISDSDLLKNITHCEIICYCKNCAPNYDFIIDEDLGVDCHMTYFKNKVEVDKNGKPLKK